MFGGMLGGVWGCLGGIWEVFALYLEVIWKRKTFQKTVKALTKKNMNLLFFIILSACCVAALQTVGAFLVIAMVITPGATAYLLTDRFPHLLTLSIIIGTLTSFLGAYSSFFLDGATGGIIVCFQTVIFITIFLFAPKHGMLALKRLAYNRQQPF